MAQITSTSDIMSIFPNLPKLDKFKTAIDVFLKIAKTPIFIDHASCWLGYTMNGIRYKTRINNGKKAIFLQKITIINTSVTMDEVHEFPNKFRDVSNIPCGQIRLQAQDYQDMFTCRCERIEDISWAKIASIFGKLLKDEIEGLVDVLYVSQCSKCNGVGKLPHYAHISEGLCFQCMGIGKWISIDEYKMNLL